MLNFYELNNIFSEIEVSISSEPSQCSCCCASYGGGKARYEFPEN